MQEQAIKMEVTKFSLIREFLSRKKERTGKEQHLSPVHDNTTSALTVL